MCIRDRNEAGPNTYIAVFTLNHRLALLQQYTSDLDLLNKACLLYTSRCV